MITVAKVLPLNGKIEVTSPYGKRTPPRTSKGYGSSWHQGVDLVVRPRGSDVTCISCEGGWVATSKYSSTLGNYVFIATDSGVGIIYMHLKERYVSAGDKVLPAQPVGMMGDTGSSGGTHLHFGCCKETVFKGYYSQTWFNPAIYWGIDESKVVKGSFLDGGTPLSSYTGKSYSGIDGTHSHTSGKIPVSDSSAGYSTDVGILSPSGEYYLLDDLEGVYSDYLYGRRYRVMIELGDGDVLDVSELRCTFNIKKTSYRKAQKSVLSIYNLNPDDENRIIKSGQRMIIEAGYNGSFYGKIFEGGIVQPVRSKERGVDYKLTLISMDSDRYLSYGIIGTALVAQQSARSAVRALTKDSIVKSEEGIISNSIINTVYPRGKVMFGMASDYLAQIAKSNNASYYNENGKVNIVDAKSVASGYIYDMSPETGLIGSPTQYEYGIKFTCLLNPTITLNSLVHIDNRKVIGMEYEYQNPIRALDGEGIYKIVSMEYVGDTRGSGQDWAINVDAIAQAGSLPAMAVGDDVYIF